MRRSAVPLLALALLAAACSADRAELPSDAATTGDAQLWRQDPNEPYPFMSPIPPLEPTAVDGIYERNVTRAEGGTDRPPCIRCAPYRINRGPALLELREGRFYVVHEAADFRSRGHFVLDGDQMILLNDAVCPVTKGVYRWTLADGRLSLEVVDDPCPFDLLRARYLSAEPWEARGG